MRAAALRTFALGGALAIAGSAGCGFAVRHPAVTVGVVAGAMTLGTCELATDEHGACFLAAGGAGAALGLIAAGALWLGSTGEDSILQPPPDPVPPVRRRSAQAPPVAAPPTASAAPAAPTAPAAPAAIPDYLKEPPQLFARSGGSIVPAPPGDHAVAATYAASPVRGPLHDGARITILTERTKYKVGEEVRVIHVLEAPEPGHTLHVMGPKPIYSEYVDGVERTPPHPGPQPYDGRVAPSPGVDWSYEVTTYRFQAPGPHRIQWRADGRESNVIELEIVP
ncbi:MAG TPA: hypothetical protein VK932_17305 [Kofleriaceae bacterium]|nr:hypothetical protein [Kofleriaceae bacterium]